MTSFKYEIKKKVDGQGKETMILDYQNYQILLKTGDYIRVGLILAGEPSEHLKKQLSVFIVQFEKKFRDYLRDFSGKASDFDGYKTMINDIFNLSLLKPHIIEKDLSPAKLNSFQKRIITIGQKLEADNQMFFISKVLEYMISISDELDKEKIIANVYDLRELGYLKPVEISQ